MVDRGDDGDSGALKAAQAPVVDASAQDTAGLVRRWSKWPAVALERLPWPYWLTAIVIALLAVGEQILEYSIEWAAVGEQPVMSPLRLAAAPLLLVYILGHFYFVKRASMAALAELRSKVMVSDEEYDKRVRHMIAANPWVELALLLTAVAVVLALLVGLRSDLLNTNSGLPALLPEAVFIIFIYVLLGWLLLTIAYSSIRQARALDALAHCPLTVNVFDPANLLPFGHLGLIQSLPIVGIVLLPLILFGAPTRGGFIVIGLSAVSFLALFVPLWGVHQQIDRAHENALAAIYDQLQEIQGVLFRGVAADPPNLGALADRTSMLIHLRKTVLEAPNWPFKDSAAVARATIAVTSPLVYFILNELIRAYLLPVLSGG